MAQPPVEDEHRAREPSGEQLVILRAAIRMASAQRDEHGSGEEREDHGDGNAHGSVIGECLLPFRVITCQRRGSSSRRSGSVDRPAHHPSSDKRFPDGAQYRVEIPSTEGPRCLEAVLEEAERLDVRVHRVSQGSGVFLLTDAELGEMARLGAEAPVEVSLFTRPNAGWGVSAMARAPAGGVVAASAHGQEQVVACLDDARRAAEHGFRSVLIARTWACSRCLPLRESGGLPTDMQAKISVMLPAANAAAARVLEQLGRAINLPTDLSLAQVAAIRAVVDCPLDVYVEAPDNVGGFVRLHEIPELIRIASPVYVKFGLRNAPDVYPSGTHLDATTVALSRERVRRARLGMELLARSATRPRCRAGRGRARRACCRLGRLERRDQCLGHHLQRPARDLARAAQALEGLLLRQAFFGHEHALRAFDRLASGESVRQRLGLCTQCLQLVVSRAGRVIAGEILLAKGLHEVAEDAGLHCARQSRPGRRRSR